MRAIHRIVVSAVMAVGVGALAASPANAASDPAVTSCSFTPIHTTYEGGQLSDPRYYYARNTRLTVTSGDGQAWFVTVNRNGDTGWMDADCVRFLA